MLFNECNNECLANVYHIGFDTNKPKENLWSILIERNHFDLVPLSNYNRHLLSTAIVG